MEEKAKKKNGCMKNFLFLAIIIFSVVYIVKMWPDPAKPEKIETKKSEKKTMPEALQKEVETAKKPEVIQKAIEQERPQETKKIEKDEIDPENTAKTKNACCDLLYELLKFKDKSDFAFYGFGTGGPYNIWLKKVENLRNSTNFKKDKISFELAAAPGVILMLGMEYCNNKGKESKCTKLQLPELKKTIDFEKYLKQQKKSAKTKKDPRRK